MFYQITEKVTPICSAFWHGGTCRLILKIKSFHLQKCVTSVRWPWMLIGKGYGRRWWWYILRYYSGIHLEIPRKTTRNASKDVISKWTGYPPDIRCRASPLVCALYAPKLYGIYNKNAAFTSLAIWASCDSNLRCWIFSRRCGTVWVGNQPVAR
jgi:hypothetical protein